MIRTWSASVQCSFASHCSIVWRTGSGARTIVTEHVDGAAGAAATAGGGAGGGAGCASAGPAAARTNAMIRVRMPVVVTDGGRFITKTAGLERATDPCKQHQAARRADQGLHLVGQVPVLVRER